MTLFWDHKALNIGELIRKHGFNIYADHTPIDINEYAKKSKNKNKT